MRSPLALRRADASGHEQQNQSGHHFQAGSGDGFIAGDSCLTCFRACRRCKISLRVGISGLVRVGAVLVVHLAMDVGPKLFYDDRDGVVSDLRPPYAESIRKRTRGCIVNIGQTVRGRVVTSRNEGSGMVGVGGCLLYTSRCV